MRRRLLLLTLVVGVLAAGVPVASSATSGCTVPGRKLGRATTYRSPNITTAPVVLYGDSISYQGYRSLQRLLPGVGVDAWWGRATTPTVDALARDVRRHRPRTVIMAIGTNDRTTPQQFLLQVRRARALLPATTRLLWVAVYVEPTPEWLGIDAQLAAVQGVQVVDWVDVNRRARGTALHSPLLSDGIHLTCAGTVAWAGMLRAAAVA